jgi:hypothetical protein
MPRLRNIQTGAVVSCSDETAAMLGPGWDSADKAAPAKRAPAKKMAAKKAAASKSE